MDRRTRDALHAMLDDWIASPPPSGMAASFCLSSGAAGVVLVAEIDPLAPGRGPRVELEMPTPAAAVEAASAFAGELDAMDRFARAARVVDAVAGGLARGAGRN